MSDSECDITNPNVFTFQNTTVSARGPNTNLSNFNFRSKYIPRNFERQRYAESVSDQRSMCYRRETSPMSIHSAYDFRSRNFQPYYNRMGSQHSVFNGRSGSPTESMRSINSSASVSATDIAFALKNVRFNKYDMKVIKEAYQKAMKHRIRKRIEKRRNKRLYHRSGHDSGEPDSDSSASSDDRRSIRTTYTENRASSRSARIDLTQYKTARDGNMVNDRTEPFRHNNFNNMLSMSTSNFSRNHTFNNSSFLKQVQPMPTQKERFRNGFLLPSQRFNRSVASSVIPENSEKHHNIMESNYRHNERNIVRNRPVANKSCESGSEEEIFSEMSVRENVKNNIKPNGKRNLESDDDLILPDKKRSKICSPTKNSQTNRKVPSKPNNIGNTNNNNSNNFEFIRPTLPVKKFKPKVQEKVIAKSKQPLTGFVEHVPATIVKNIESIEPINCSPEKPNDNQIQIESDSTQNSDVSMRPSFIKRKLFTQKLDVAEKANLSSDASNSPQSNVYSAIHKEKNKARKLVATQSYLNRDVQEDNNLLDLIHKIVPPDRMNVTNQTMTSQSKIDVNNSNEKDDDDKLDITSVISMCNEKDVSDTFTDEEIFVSENNKKDAKNNKIDKPKNTNKSTKVKEKSPHLPKECKIVVEKMPYSQIPTENQSRNLINSNLIKNTTKNSAKTFWDTDIESDAECQITTQKNYMREDQHKGNVAVEVSNQEFKQPAAVPQSPVSKKRFQVPETSRWLNNTKDSTVMNNTLGSTRKLNISTLSVRSHRTTIKKKCCNETCIQETISSKPVVVSKNASKPIIKNKISTTEIKQADVLPSKNSMTKSGTKAEVEKKTSAKKSKPKSNADKANKSRSISRIRKSPKETKSKAKKCSLDISHNQSFNKRPIRACRTPSQNRSTENSRSSRQFDISPLTVIAQRTSKRQKCLNDSSFNEIVSKPEINIKNPKSKVSNAVNEPNKKSAEKSKSEDRDKICTKNSKPKNSKPNTRNFNQSISSSQTSKSLQNTKHKPSNKLLSNILQSPSDRPIRLCRTPSQNR